MISYGDISSNAITSLKETSKDNSGEKNEYMTMSLLFAINFDIVKDEYIHLLSLSKQQVPHSS